MDDDELLQQCSNKNGVLIDFLSKDENITKLISYITRPWQEHMTRIVQHLTEQEALAEQKEADPNTSPLVTSPLSAHGLHSITTIQEEDDEPDPSPSNVRISVYSSICIHFM